jgi:hypothetical protein
VREHRLGGFSASVKLRKIYWSEKTRKSLGKLPKLTFQENLFSNPKSKLDRTFLRRLFQLDKLYDEHLVNNWSDKGVSR